MSWMLPDVMMKEKEQFVDHTARAGTLKLSEKDYLARLVVRNMMSALKFADMIFENLLKSTRPCSSNGMEMPNF